jgi:hypothetical protein
VRCPALACRDGIRGTILDNILARMEQYANTLERLVKERTEDYQRQKQRAEDLVRRLMHTQ